MMELTNNTDLDFSINRSKVKPEVSNKLLKGVAIVTIFTISIPLNMDAEKTNNIIMNYLPSCVSFPMDYIYKRSFHYRATVDNDEFIYLKLSRGNSLKVSTKETCSGDSKHNILKLRSSYVADFFKLVSGINVDGDIFEYLCQIRKTFLDYMSNYFDPYSLPDEVRECILGNADIHDIKKHPCKFNAEVSVECILNDELS